jgi:hypothetical protein
MKKYTIFHKHWNPPTQLYWYYTPLFKSDRKDKIMKLVKPHLKDAVKYEPDSNQIPSTTIVLMERKDDGTDLILESWCIHNFELTEGKVVGQHFE